MTFSVNDSTTSSFVLILDKLSILDCQRALTGHTTMCRINIKGIVESKDLILFLFPYFPFKELSDKDVIALEQNELRRCLIYYLWLPLC